MLSEAWQRPACAHSIGSTAARLVHPALQMPLLGQWVGFCLLCASCQAICSTCLSASTCMAHTRGTCSSKVLHGMPGRPEQHARPAILHLTAEMCIYAQGPMAAALMHGRP